MISKLYVNIDDKLVLYKFKLIKNDSNIIISCNRNFIKIPIYNSLNGLDYYTINFPLELIIYDNKIFNPYILISSFIINIENDIDFFFNLQKIIENKYKLKFLNFKEVKIYHINNYLINTCDNKESNLWLKINLLKLLFFISNNNSDILIKEYKILIDQLKIFKYNIHENDYEILYKFNEWTNNINNINFNNLKKDNYYYIKNNQKENNIKKIKILEILENEKKILIEFNNTAINISYSNYLWFIYNPKNKINKEFFIYNLSKNYDFNLIILKYILSDNLSISYSYNDILDYYYYCNNKLSNLITLNNFNDLTLIQKKSFTNNYFIELINKSSEDKIFNILTILFNNYNYPLKINRNEIDDTFDYIIYVSLYHYKKIYINDTIKLNYLEIIPVKIKNLYLNILKLFINIINNSFDNITYNQKYYNDYLHRNIIKLYLINSSKISVKLIKELTSTNSYDKFKSIFSRNLLLYDISYKLTWVTLSKKLNYLNIFYKNLDIVFYQNKINKNIITDNFDVKIKKIIENPLEMYKYLKKEKDFIKWTRFIHDKLNNLYYISINLTESTKDIINIGKMIYLLLNIDEQNLKEVTYFNFVNFCIEHSHLILHNTRINLKIKENFNNLKCNINLGYLAKDLTWHKNSISFDNEPIILPKEILENKLKIATDKYLKYKSKYLKCKNKNIII